jgi:hypothetical protein
MTTFDPTAFLNQTFEDANSTVSVPVPESEPLAIADKVDLNTWQKRDGSASGLKLDIVWDIQDAEILAMLDRPKATVRQSIMLDLTDSGQLDFGKGKNVQLGRLRAALDLNEPGKPFSFAMIQGRMGKVSVKHRIDGDQIYAEVKGVAHP